MITNAEFIKFDYSEEDTKLFEPIQQTHWDNIERNYKKLQDLCLPGVTLAQFCTQREWVTSRVNLHISQSLMRLLYLVEDFCNSSKTFNSVGTAALLKSIVEIPLHLGNIAWILANLNDFEKIKEELSKMAFGNRDLKSGLTTSIKITHKELYMRSDEMIRKLFKDSSTINIFESLYKDANATGHHNYEARMLTGIQNKDIWKAKDRKEAFVFFSNSVFPFFMQCDSALAMSSIMLNATEHYLTHLPLNFSSTDI